MESSAEFFQRQSFLIIFIQKPRDFSDILVVIFLKLPVKLPPLKQPDIHQIYQSIGQKITYIFQRFRLGVNPVERPHNVLCLYPPPKKITGLHPLGNSVFGGRPGIST